MSILCVYIFILYAFNKNSLKRLKLKAKLGSGLGKTTQLLQNR